MTPLYKIKRFSRQRWSIFNKRYNFNSRGDCNDYVGKGLSGGKIIVESSPKSRLVSKENTIIGNTIIWQLQAFFLLRARPGEICRKNWQFSNSRGVRCSYCEYMTGEHNNTGSVGDNFGAGRLEGWLSSMII